MNDNKEQNTMSENIGVEKMEQSYDVPPSANVQERDGANNKKLKIVGIVVLGILVMLIGIGIAVGRMGEARTAAKAEEAEKIANEQKKMSENRGVDIAKDQEQIQANTFHDMPPPADLEQTDPMMVAEQQPTTVVAPAQPSYQPQYNSYQEPQPYTPQAQPVIEPNAQIPVSVSNGQEVPNDVLVDVYGTAQAVAAASKPKETGLATQFQSSKLASGSASKRGDTTMLLTKGTSIPCVMRTKIDSTYKGFTTCQISRDVYSANGKVLLVERGSTVFGEQNVEIKQGQARVAVLWSRIETPKGVSVDIDSPAAGQVGEMGIGAKVNNHFWKRFGGAIMLSMIKDVSANASTNLAKNGQQTQNTTQNSTAAAESMAEKALDSTINIPPTATVNQGKLIQIMVIRDVDFGGLYELRKY